MKIAVTGGAGMIGSNLIRFLNKMGEKNIHVFDKIELCDKKIQNIRDLEFDGAIEPLESLLTDTASNYFDVIFHLAANSSTDCKASDSQKDYIDTTKLAQHCPDRVVFASSAGVYGNPDDPHPLTWYAFFKKKAEQSVLFYGGKSLRLFNVFGPGEEIKKGQNSPFYRYTIAGLRGSQVVKYDMSERRDFVPVEFVCKKLWESANNKTKKIQDIGSGLSLSFQEVAEVVEKKLGKSLRFVKGFRSNQTQYFTKSDMSYSKDMEGSNPIEYYENFYFEYIKNREEKGLLP